jgi:hypothetical protein
LEDGAVWTEFICLRIGTNLWNVFTEMLPSNDKGIDTQAHRESRLTAEELLEAVFSLRNDP